ncbi:carbohydrate kinase family protein [Asticcacaulis sp. AND118]|uniref:carbohydrate kinase family protein n=1 Tax=Asticcacaulis sp. AND118 TaxID=2840468 RepID=UPI001CFF89BF|nr:carbohydrate kinase family protein [Asticcacaulis sp. AND118]UDF03027.1 carbohydrate kinase family protein [Asticcacaulis sp. AND118]
MPLTAALSGFATLDFIATAPHPLPVTGTVMGQCLTDTAWPRPGGASLYAGRRIARSGLCAAAVTVLGDDATGDAYMRACADAGMNTDGVHRLAGGKSPCCLLIYRDTGDYSCLLDPGRTANRPDSAQLAVCRDADWVVISAAPAQWTRAVLDSLRPEQVVVWIVKNDPACFPPPLAQRLCARADLIFCNSGERRLTDSARPRIGLIETLGAAGVRIVGPHGETALPVTPISVRDTTGAGDTLAGETIAQLMAEMDLCSAATAGIAAAAELLQGRR